MQPTDTEMDKTSLKRKILEQLMNHMDEQDREDMKKFHPAVMEHTKVHLNSEGEMKEPDTEETMHPEPDEDDSSSEPQFINPLDMYARRKYSK